MTGKRNSIPSQRSPSHKNRDLDSWHKGIKRVMMYLRKKRDTYLTYLQVFQIIEAFFELSFQAQIRGYRYTWPAKNKRMEMHILKYIGKPKTSFRSARLSFVFPDRHLGYEFVIEPAGVDFVNYGYEFIPDIIVRKEIVKFMNENPEIAEKLIP